MLAAERSLNGSASWKSLSRPHLLATDLTGGRVGAQAVGPLDEREAVELRQLRHVVAVAEELRFGRAAERPYVAQPAVSEEIRKREANGVRVFDHTPGGGRCQTRMEVRSMSSTNRTARLFGARAQARALDAWRGAAQLVWTRWQTFVEAEAETREWAFAAYVSALDEESAAAAELAGRRLARAA
jgi:Bacterial regulatory helix-turn-helix protein, lysR family